MKDNEGEVVMSGIHTYGVPYIVIERKNYKGAFMPGYRHGATPFQNG